MRYLKLFESTNGDVQEILDGLEDIWVELTDEFYVNLDIESIICLTELVSILEKANHFLPKSFKLAPK